MEDEKNIDLNKDENADDEYILVPMFEEFEDNGEFPTKINDIFGVMA